MQVIRTTRPNTALLPQMFANSPALQGRYSGGTKAFFSNSPAQMPADPTALGAGSGPDIQRRMSAAFDRLQAEELVKDTATKVDSKTARTLGKLVLEFEQVNNNLRGMQKGIKEDIREQKNLFKRKKKLKWYKKCNLTILMLKKIIYLHCQANLEYKYIISKC